MSARAPIAGAALWTAVMGRNDGACTCAAVCGNRHRDSGGVCGRRDAVTVAPRDLGVPLATAVTLSVGELTVWCERCRAAVEAAIRKARREANAADYAADSLF
ncbi:hypothetical protein ACIBSV_15370 [Embleya sp. NPDC050154]|uniref:hypothetical protein n=1 Tax=Embleya sp. NPDC050154 TaxID=3363988 RepID=UPI00379BCFAB